MITFGNERVKYNLFTSTLIRRLLRNMTNLKCSLVVTCGLRPSPLPAPSHVSDCLPHSSFYRSVVASLPSSVQRYYFERLQLNSTQLRVSVAAAGRLPEDLQSLKSTLGLILVNLEDATVDFGQFSILSEYSLGTFTLQPKLVRTHQNIGTAQ